MKELVVLSVLFSFGIALNTEQALFELTDLMVEGERNLDLANSIANDSKSKVKYFFQKLREQSSCIDLKKLKDDYSNFTSEIEEIMLPMDNWISQMTNQMRDLNVALDYIKLYAAYATKDSSIDLPDLFFGDCNSPVAYQNPEEDIDTNDIYEYQNKTKDGSGLERFKCGSGESIDYRKICDRALDCWDGSDELGSCAEIAGCEGCPLACARGPWGARCLPRCDPDLMYTTKVCVRSGPRRCFSVCIPKHRLKPISTRCLLKVFPRLLDTTENHYLIHLSHILLHYRELMNSCQNKKSDYNEKYNPATTDKTDSSDDYVKDSTTFIEETWETTTSHPTWHPTSRHPTWHPTTRHPTWHPTTRHPTWHPTTRHPTWHPTTEHPTWHPTWHPTTRHPTWHPTTRHPTWHPTTWHPTWHPTTRHPTWHPTTRHPTWHPTTDHPTWHPTWHPTTRHPTWHPTTSHPTWHPTTEHPTWHPTTRHPTWHPTRHTTWPSSARPTNWDPAAIDSKSNSDESDYSSDSDESRHHTTKHTTHHATKHTTPHSTTAHTKHTTRHHTTKHTTKHTTTPSPPTTQTTPPTTTTSPTATTEPEEIYTVID